MTTREIAPEESETLMEKIDLKSTRIGTFGHIKALRLRTMYRLPLSSAHSRRQETADVSSIIIIETVTSGAAPMRNIQMLQ